GKKGPDTGGPSQVRGLEEAALPHWHNLGRGACFHKKKPRRGAGLRIRGERRSFFGGRARRLVPITAQRVGMRDAHVAASVRAGGGVPLVRCVSVAGPRHVIGRRPARVWQFPKGGSGGVSGIPHQGMGGLPSSKTPPR